MSTLLIRLAGPMQSWGTQSRFRMRDTGLEPSKSGVIGLLCAALGKPRDEKAGDGWPSLRQLSELRMGVRVDREGFLKFDYQTAGGVHRKGDIYGVRKVDGSLGETVPSRRYYLADADFLVGLESENESLLLLLDRALAEPMWPLFLGRKAFVSSVPPRLPDSPPRGPGLVDAPLEKALKAYPWFKNVDRDRETVPDYLRLVLDADPIIGEDVRQDVPLSFEPNRRRFALRYVRTEFVAIGEVVPVLEE